jgi:hypothetical protein
MDAGHVIPETIQALLEKRTTFQDWLSRLEALGSDFRPDVAEKVRSDYEGRLTEVEGELEGHRTELESALAERSATADRIAGRHDAHCAELEETELRHAVGEFDEEEWERLRSEQQSAIDELEDDLSAQRSAVESLQTVLGELAGAAVIAAPAELEPPVVEELAAAEDEAPEIVEVVEVEEESTWMTQPFEGTELASELEEAVEDVAALELVEEVIVETEDADAEFVEAKVVEAEPAPDEEVDISEERSESEPVLDQAEPGEFMDELEFLESLSLDDADNFDAVSALLDEEGGDSGADADSERKTEDL